MTKKDEVVSTGHTELGDSLQSTRQRLTGKGQTLKALKEIVKEEHTLIKS